MNIEELTVSVIIPNYNHAKYLRQRIDSVLNQTFRDYELIILDDFSQDGSRAIIEEYKKDHPEITTVFNISNSGSPCSQWNLGVSIAQGEFLWIAESDDYAEPEFLEKTVSAMRNDNESGLVFCDSKIVNEEKRIEYFASERPSVKNRNTHRYLSGHRKNDISIRSFVENPIANVSSVLFRKSAYLKAGQADTSMKFCGDWFLYIRILLISGIRYIPEVFSVYRLHEGSRFHLHYRSNQFLFEKLKIYFFILRNLKLSFQMFFHILSGVLKILTIRTLCFFRINNLLLPELPRIPKKFEYIT